MYMLIRTPRGSKLKAKLTSRSATNGRIALAVAGDAGVLVEVGGLVEVGAGACVSPVLAGVAELRE
jgi:hypothetical protein